MKDKIALILILVVWAVASSVDGTEAAYTYEQCRADAEAQGLTPPETAYCESLQPKRPREKSEIFLRRFEDGSATLVTRKEICKIPAYDSRGDHVRCRRR